MDPRKVLMVGGVQPAFEKLRELFTRWRFTLVGSGTRPKGFDGGLILLDLRERMEGGLTLLKEVREERADLPVVVLGEKRVELIVGAIKLGATDYIAEPFDPSQLRSTVQGVLAEKGISWEIPSQEPGPSKEPAWLFSPASAAMSEVKSIIHRIAETDLTVLVRGESGTGKSLVARAIYSASLRRNQPFVKVNCAALPRELLESELFGYEKGAFTGAVQPTPGKFGLAHLGTIFLDEISEIHPSLQAKLLHVLESGEIARVGGELSQTVNVRVIAATSANLEQMAVSGLFRADLFFRLNVVSVFVPSLRERRSEIPVLTDYFLNRYQLEYGKPRHDLSEETKDLLMRYDWPGNVRELENFIKRVVILEDERSSHSLLASRTADSRPDQRFSLKQISREMAKKMETELIRSVLSQTRWNRRRAAQILKISYRTLLYKIKEIGVEPSSPTSHQAF